MAEAVADSKMSVRQIAGLAKTSPGQVSQWQTEGGVQAENVKADVLERICGALNIRTRWLLYNEPPKRPDYGTREPSPLYGAGTQHPGSEWKAYMLAPEATRAAVDILLLPAEDREHVTKAFPHLVTGISLLEAWAREALNARKSA